MNKWQHNDLTSQHKGLTGRHKDLTSQRNYLTSDGRNMPPKEINTNDKNKRGNGNPRSPFYYCHFVTDFIFSSIIYRYQRYITLKYIKRWFDLAVDSNPIYLFLL